MKGVPEGKVLHIVLILIIVVLLGYIMVEQTNKLIEKKSQESYEKGQKDMVTRIGNTGEIPFSKNDTVTWFPIKQVCGD